ncbi:hypothetical protein AA313_de0208249 [Arthrobotrys entomopaga]|nr:hypothetical protein AA313_de0208249 [Arthrobotrys entomopaga]
MSGSCSNAGIDNKPQPGSAILTPSAAKKSAKLSWNSSDSTSGSGVALVVVGGGRPPTKLLEEAASSPCPAATVGLTVIRISASLERCVLVSLVPIQIVRH